MKENSALKFRLHAFPDCAGFCICFRACGGVKAAGIVILASEALHYCGVYCLVV